MNTGHPTTGRRQGAPRRLTLAFASVQGSSFGCLFLLTTLSVAEGDGYVGLGVQAFSQALPALALVFVFRAVAGRAGLPALVVPMLAAQAAVDAAFVAGYLTFGYHLPAAALTGLLLAVAIAAQGPGWKSLFSDLIPREDFRERYAGISSLNNVFRLVSPALAGAALSLGGGWIWFAADALLCVVAAVVVARVRRAVRTAPGERTERSAADAAPVPRPARWPFLLPFALICVFGFNIQLFAPVLATGVLGLDAGYAGILMASHTLGAILGSYLSGRVRLGTSALFGGAGLALGALTLLLPLPDTLWLALSLLVVVGAARGAALTTSSVIPVLASSRQEARDDLFARSAVFFAGSNVVSAPLVALLLEHGPPATAFYACGAGCMAAGLLWLVVGPRWMRAAAGEGRSPAPG
ncbi:MFS transporter [Marinactinospora thermotolerans]|uniref:Arabinose efflux permease n=1 Tax=Marinactinospora thermotolerans DSM 45154 TaxID=1122192 RepID=A0A1T4KLW1_9ACTN|nr:MFS transporter [Marinactinospora thermotolerans]SJZ43384.1 Arabinose efflux permease [Marinactinospora thermotolerans DSM 45154]